MKYLSIIILITALFASCKDGVKKNVDKNEDGKILEIKSYLTEQAKKDSLHGVVLIGKNDEIILNEAYGYVDLDSIEKHTLEGQLGLASMGKMFTALAIMKLESQGKLALEDLASKYLNNIENNVIRDSVKIKHFLSHTSGLGSYWDELGDDERGNDLEYIYSLIKNDTLVGSFGKHNYSNSGYIFLGKIIEKVTGMPYSEYVQKKILNPCQMSSTEINSPDGGGKTTAEDMWKFGQALRKKEFVDDKFKIMIQKQSDGDYGYGFMVKTLNSSKIYGHTGGYWEEGEKLGVASALDIIHEEYTVVVLTNRNPSLGGKKVRDYLHETLTSEIENTKQ
ncbi:beta-lactamase family protein [Flagellimonas sp. 389]|uniref:serine hydrolase domain-containing protein n=1 Tax=Flagellimonas sp. 389 TaxID=2835862 RepID=UPI001BD20B8B|nr:serine hydrolase domain-containing protein [Flagellimonas sp. 389]MBS9463518.1 beta-lactamase family protein [Flagellimonas sp. 389]